MNNDKNNFNKFKDQDVKDVNIRIPEAIRVKYKLEFVPHTTSGKLKLKIQPEDTTADIERKLEICRQYGVDVIDDRVNESTPTEVETTSRFFNVPIQNSQQSTLNNETTNVSNLTNGDTGSTNILNNDSQDTANNHYQQSNNINNLHSEQSGDSNQYSAEKTQEQNDNNTLENEIDDNVRDTNRGLRFNEKSDEPSKKENKDHTSSVDNTSSEDVSNRTSKQDNSQNTKSNNDANSNKNEATSEDQLKKENNKYRNNKSNQNTENRDLRKKNYQHKKSNNYANGTKKVGKEAGKEAGKQAAKKGAKEGAKKAAAASAKKSTAQAAKAGLSALLKNPYVWIAIVVILIIVLLFVLILLLNNNSYSSNTQCGVSDTIPGGAGGTGDLKIEYVKMKVPEKIKVKTKGKYTYYDIDDYVAGVLYAEPGNQNDELLKAFAIAARSLALSKMQSQGFIINSSANQNFATNAKNRKGKYRRIAEETSGIVMVTGKPGKYKYAAAAYDVVCLDPKKGGGVTATEYIMCQAQVHIPKSWMNKQHYSEKRLRSYTYHGLGMSFLGAKYLTLEKKYTASDLLKLFYKNYTVVSIYPNTDYVANSSSVTENKCANNIVDLNIKETPSSATIIHDQSIENFLAQHGSSIKQVNDGLLNTVKSAGIGTRAAVTKGAVYTINTFLNYGARLPYMNGGSLIYAMNPLWGSKLSKPVIKKTDNVVYEYWYEGLDCGRFVRWVFLNAGINLPTVGASSFLSIPGTVKHDASDVTQYVAQPGDVLVRGDGGHVVLVLNYFENGSNKGYYVAEASGGDSGILVKKRLLSNLKSKNYYAIDMSSVYNGNQYKTSNFESVYNSKRKE